MIGRSGERGSGISVLAARHDDDNDDESYYNGDYVSACRYPQLHYNLRLNSFGDLS